MCDYSEAELQALELAFPTVKVYLCDFHREQAWDRWVRNHKHGLAQDEQRELLTFLRQCAWAPPLSTESEDQVISPFNLAVQDLKNSKVRKTHDSVRQWLSTKWLPIAQLGHSNEIHSFPLHVRL